MSSEKRPTARELREEVNELALAAVLDLTGGQRRTDTVTYWSLSLGRSVTFQNAPGTKDVTGSQASHRLLSSRSRPRQARRTAATRLNVGTDVRTRAESYTGRTVLTETGSDGQA